MGVLQYAPTNNQWGRFETRRGTLQRAPTKHHRRSIRLKGYDYSQPGAYFVTIGTHNKECVFGDVIDGHMYLNEFGKIIEKEWLKTFDMRKNLVLDEYVVMPNHFHGIIMIEGRGVLQYAQLGTVKSRGIPPLEGQRARRGILQYAPTYETFGKPIPNSIPTIVRLFKSTTTKQINGLRNTPGESVWQRNYYEHIIRNEDELNQVREYIINNPMQWQFDRENPAPTGVSQYAPTNNQWGCLEEKIYGKTKQ